jgi:adenine-specific DNA-methyltransferase
MDSILSAIAPKQVELPRRPIRKGDEVRVLPPRGCTKIADQKLWTVTEIHKDVDGRFAKLELLGSTKPETQSVAVADWIV